MNKKPPFILLSLLCLPAATLPGSGTAAAENLLEYSKKTDSPSLYINGDW